jgi:hypothetical protein
MWAISDLSPAVPIAEDLYETAELSGLKTDGLSPVPHTTRSMFASFDPVPE